MIDFELWSLNVVSDRKKMGDTKLLSIDSPAVILSDQTVNLPRLSSYLQSNIPGLTGEIELSQFPSGHSNLTYLIKAGSRELVLKCEPPGSKAKSAHDMGREFRILSRLHGPYPYAPEAIHFCEDESVIGGKFCVMQRLTGIIVRGGYPEHGGVTLDQIRAQFTGLIEAQARLHLLDISDAGLAEFGRPQGYRQRQVDGWSKRLSDARTEGMADFREVTSWLVEQLPTYPEEAAVVHNDFKMDNLVWDPADITRLIGVLDWEMATVGDPLIDLACTLSFWAEEDDPVEFRSIRGMPSARPGMLTRRQAIARYTALTRRSVERADFYLCFGFFRRAVIEQQKYFRYLRAETRDSRFSRLDEVVRILRDMAVSVLRGETSV
jgi:aminoglycoside phosphotransferase (APT) family kinase protein